MVELMITLLIIAVGLLGLASLQTQAVRTTTDAGQRTAGVQLATELVERMHMNSAQALAYQAAFAGGCPAVAPAQCSSGRVGQNIVAGVACTAAQMANYDVWESLCDHGNLTDGRGKSAVRDYMINPQVNMVCNPAACAAGSTVSITLSWQGRPDARKAIAPQDTVVINTVL